MMSYYLTFRSVTAAQLGQRTVEAAGIPAAMQRTPGPLARRGCGYCLRIAPRWAGAAAAALRGTGVERCYRRTEDGYTEVDCALL